jgi:hypothetical protein
VKALEAYQEEKGKQESNQEEKRQARSKPQLTSKQ